MPEIQRCGLGAVVLMLKANKVDDVLKFDYIDAPPNEAILNAMQDLYALQAIDANNALTTLGRQMADFPIEPRYAKILLSAKACMITKKKNYFIYFILLYFSNGNAPRRSCRLWLSSVLTRSFIRPRTIASVPKQPRKSLSAVRVTTGQCSMCCVAT